MSQINVLSNGNVGIGTTNPDSKFSINASSNNTWTSIIRNGGGNAQGLLLRIGYAHKEATIMRLDDWAGNLRMTVLGNGQVGIGKIPANDRMLDVLGHVYGNGYWLTSDERLKSEIKPITDEKNRLYLLQGKSYIKALPPIDSEEISFKDASPEYGYLAQELKEIFPILVSEGSTDYCAVNYIGLIPIIVEVLKDQRLTIENLQKEIQEKVESLEKALAIYFSKNEESMEKSFQQFNLADPMNAHVEEMKVYQNAPNPFSERTTVQCYIPQAIKKAELCVYNMQGVQVKCLPVSERGTVDVQIQAGRLAAGVYTYLLIGDGKTSDAKQMILTN